MQFWIFTFTGVAVVAQQVAQQKIVWNEREKPIAEQIRILRQVSDEKRGEVTKQLALRIRDLGPALGHKLLLADSLANLSTEGDYGHEALQEVGATLAQALSQQAAISKNGMPEEPYVELALLIRYEGVLLPVEDPLLRTAMARLQSEEQRRQKADFTLTDLEGHAWTLSNLRGKVVLLNFWATWCPPCRKEMPDLDALYRRFHSQGLEILAISDEDSAKVKPFLAEKPVAYPVLLDRGRAVNQLMAVEGIPKSFLYDRDGKLVAQAMDMRTRGQFLEMLSKAGLK